MSDEVIASVLNSLATIVQSVDHRYDKDLYIKQFDELLLQLREGAKQNKTIDLGEAVNTLAEALDNDRELYQAYKSNIAMAFKDEYHAWASVQPTLMDGPKYISPASDINLIANEAAKRFLNMFIQSTNPPKE